MVKKTIFICALITAASMGMAGCAPANAKDSPTVHVEFAKETTGVHSPGNANSATDAESAASPGSATDAESAASGPANAAESAASATNVSIPTLTVTYGQDRKEIPSCSGGYELSHVNGDGTTESVIACGAEPLSYLTEKSGSLPYIELGTDIFLDFTEGTTPDAITLQDIILREDGSHKYDDRTITEIPLIPAAASFSLDVNPAAMLSSDMSSYEKGGILRGFRVNCTWKNGSSAEYGFVLRTDASA